MQAIQADRRTLTFDENYALFDRAAAQAEAAREANIALAKTLLEIRRTRAFVALGCSSVEMYGRRLGYETHEQAVGETPSGAVLRLVACVHDENSKPVGPKTWSLDRLFRQGARWSGCSSSGTR